MGAKMKYILILLFAVACQAQIKLPAGYVRIKAAYICVVKNDSAVVLDGIGKNTVMYTRKEVYAADDSQKFIDLVKVRPNLKAVNGIAVKISEEAEKVLDEQIKQAADTLPAVPIIGEKQ
jgi:hypothetical protein